MAANLTWPPDDQDELPISYGLAALDRERDRLQAKLQHLEAERLELLNRQ